jgi:hypothetical protein
VRYCCAINGTQPPADIYSVVGILPLLITQILADMTIEEPDEEEEDWPIPDEPDNPENAP